MEDRSKVQVANWQLQLYLAFLHAIDIRETDFTVLPRLLSLPVYSLYLGLHPAWGLL